MEESTKKTDRNKMKRDDEEEEKEEHTNYLFTYPVIEETNYHIHILTIKQ